MERGSAFGPTRGRATRVEIEPEVEPDVVTATADHVGAMALGGLRVAFHVDGHDTESAGPRRGEVVEHSRTCLVWHLGAWKSTTTEPAWRSTSNANRLSVVEVTLPVELRVELAVVEDLTVSLPPLRRRRWTAARSDEAAGCW